MESGFNLLRLKKEEESTVNRYFKRHLVIGDDLYSLNVVHELLKRSDISNEQVAWLSPREVTPRDLIPVGPTPVRGKENIEAFRASCPNVETLDRDAPAQFYKDMKWRPFGGRAKSEPLQWGEELYTKPSVSFEYQDIFSFLTDEDELNLILEKRIDLDLSSVKAVTPDDLAEPAYFNIKASNGDEITCEYLYWGRGPASFTNSYDGLDDLSSQFIEFCESTQTPSCLSIVMNFSCEVVPMKETLFIPLSYTHEWGHFMGEFSECKNGEQSARFMTFLDENSSSEEDISKKIRLFKRNLEKIFPNILTQMSDEFIKISDEVPCLKVDDSVAWQLGDMPKHLQFVSVNAPIAGPMSDHSLSADSLPALVGMARALVVNQTLFQKQLASL